jgi:hypothetical protein
MTELVAGHIVAGHSFAWTNGVERCVCGRTWDQISECTVDDVGKLELAHVGALNNAELEQIWAYKEEKARQRDAIWEAVIGVAKA